MEPLFVNGAVAAVCLDGGQAGIDFVAQFLVALAKHDAEIFFRKMRVFHGFQALGLRNAVGNHAVVANGGIHAARCQLGDDERRAFKAADVGAGLAEFAAAHIVSRGAAHNGHFLARNVFERSDAAALGHGDELPRVKVGVGKIVALLALVVDGDA